MKIKDIVTVTVTYIAKDSIQARIDHKAAKRSEFRILAVGDSLDIPRDIEVVGAET